MKIQSQPQIGSVNVNGGVAKRLGYFAQAGPHALTTRTSATVGPGKRVHIYSVAMSMYCNIVPTADEESAIHCVIQRAGGAEQAIADLSHYGVTVGAGVTIVCPLDIFCNSGDIIRIRTVDGKIGGAIVYNAMMPFTEYDV